MTSTRARLHELLDALPDDQIETVLGFVLALQAGRVVISACDVPESAPAAPPEALGPSPAPGRPATLAGDS